MSNAKLVFDIKHLDKNHCEVHYKMKAELIGGELSLSDADLYLHMPLQVDDCSIPCKLER